MHERKIDKYRNIISVAVFLLLAFALWMMGGFVFRWLGFGAWILSYFIFPAVRYGCGHVDLLLSSLAVYIYRYYKYKQYNMPDSYIGTIDCFVADSAATFGCCKTLSAVREARSIYKKFNGASAFDYKCQNPHWITWQVRIMSNVEIADVPTIPFVSLEQLVELSEVDTDGILTVVLMDECNAIMNSRNFKSNFQNEEQIKSIVTCRHNNIYLMMVGQRFEYLDKLIRSMSDRVIMCKHIPYFNTLRHRIYSAPELDKAINPQLVKAQGIRFKYLFKSDYDSYDTKALVDNIAKDESISSTELLARKGGGSDLIATRELSAKGKKLRYKL